MYEEIIFKPAAKKTMQVQNKKKPKGLNKIKVYIAQKNMLPLTITYKCQTKLMLFTIQP